MKPTASGSGNWTKRSPKKLKCICASSFQDKNYGVGIRLHNAIKSNTDLERWRCTVCKSEKP